MEFNWIDILKIAGSLAFFIYGMKVMSEGIQRLAGSQMRRVIESMTKKPSLGVLTGLLVTGLIQSSSATTVLTVSFVNAGLLSLVESAGVIIGANIGTTVTGWLIAAFGFNFSIYTLCLPILAIGVPLIFIKKDRFRYWGEVLIGFAILFISLEMLKTTFPDSGEKVQLLGFLQNYTGTGIGDLAIFLFVGMLVTAILQSSSAAIVLTFVLCAQGWLPFHSGAAMVLGENIGTTITAEIAALVGNVSAKRAARIHTLFNVIGAIWMLPFVPVVTRSIEKGVQVMSSQVSLSIQENLPIGIAIFHTLFNLLNALLMTGFIKGLVNIASRTLPSRGEYEYGIGLRRIPTIAETPELSILQVNKEVARFGDITSRMLGFTRDYLFNNDLDIDAKLFQRIKKYEKITDKFALELADYLGKLSQVETSIKTTTRIHGYLNIIDNLEDCADIFFQMAKNIQQKKSNRIWFTPSQRNRIKEMFTLIEKAFEVMKSNFKATANSPVNIEEARQIEKRINKLKRELRKKNMKDLDKQEFNIKSSVVYYALFTSCEKIGDHILDISETIAGE